MHHHDTVPGHIDASSIFRFLELTVILSLGAFVLVPLSMVLLALCLVYRPDCLEVV